VCLLQNARLRAHSARETRAPRPRAAPADRVHRVASQESFATPYPLYFDEGEGEAKPCGHIGVHSVLTYKRFQALMSQKTNLPVSSLSAVFVCRRTVRAAGVRLSPCSGPLPA
jgi:hypothetical protein